MWHMADWKYAENLIHHMHDSFLCERLSLKSMFSSQWELSFNFLIKDISLLFSFHLVLSWPHVKENQLHSRLINFFEENASVRQFCKQTVRFHFLNLFLNHFVISILCLSFVIFPRMKGLLCKRGPNNLNRDKLPLIQHKIIKELRLNSL